MDPTSRLRLATRIHFTLLRQFGTTVPVSDLLDGSGEGREALWVCAASGDAGLAALARELERANKRFRGSPMPAEARAPATPVALQPGRVPQETAWAEDTSGFGITRPPEPVQNPRRSSGAAGWFAPLDWLRRGTAR